MEPRRLKDIDVRSNVSLREYTTFQIGGPAEYFIEVADVPELGRAVAWAKAEKVAVTMLGGGSNVFVADEGVRGLVIHNEITGREVAEDGNEILLTVGAGEVFDEVVAFAVKNGWWGLENLSCIPGSVGATPIQNIGAYGVETKDCIEYVEVYDTDRSSTARLTKEACRFGYRDSIFKHDEGKRYIVTRVAYRLSKTPNPILHYADLARWRAARPASAPPTLPEIRTAVCEIRSEKFPDWKTVGTAGSFFKNPSITKERYAELLKQYPDLPAYPASDGSVKVPLGWILDRILGLRGYRNGNIGVYEGQALVVVNHGGATATELETFVQEVAQRVFDATQICVEWEVTKLF